MSKKTILIIIFSVLSVMVAQISTAAVIDVTTTQDNVPGSLRAAITTANNNNKDNTIHLPAGVYFLSGAQGEDANAGGDLDINTHGRKLTIIGSGKTNTDIDGNEIDRVLHILNGTVTISDLTIRKGNVTLGSIFDGGGIDNNGDLTLTRCVIKENKARYGGGHGGGIYNQGMLTLNECIIKSNSAGNGRDNIFWGDGGNGGHGGAVYNNGTLILNNCTITDNRAGIGGWGRDDDGFDGNGGGVCNDGTLTMSECTVNDNYCGYNSGGGICNTINAYLTLSNSTISNNGGGIYNDGNSQLSSVTVAYNDGGIFNNSNGYLTLSNSTVSNNGRGLYNGGNSKLISVTVAYNANDGIFNTGSISLKNSIVAQNTDSHYEYGSDCRGTFNQVSYSLIEDTNGCTLTGFQKANILGKDPLLGPLQNNGGSTFTHALLRGSPAIDAGNSSNLTLDQRGYARPLDIPGVANVSDSTDIGAYEYKSYLPSPYYNLSGKITYYGMALPGVTLVFSNNGGAAAAGADGNYSHPVPYSWSGTVTPAKEGYTFNPSSRNYTTVNAKQSNQDFTAISLIPPQISLNRDQLNFGADTSGKQTGPQSFLISNSGGGILNWTVVAYTSDDNWLTCNPASGTGSTMATVSINPSGLLPGAHQGTITVADPNAINSPQTVNVTLTIYDAGSTNLPFGSFDTPSDGAVATGSIPVTGWAIDNIGLESVKIYRNSTADGSSELAYIGDVIFVEGARPDIETIYPGYPNGYKAGWGYLLLTNALPDQGNGTFTLYAKAADKEGNTVTLGSKTITCDNINAVKPFGAIDTPAPGGAVSGKNYANFGWTLTPLPNTIPRDGSTIKVWVDGVSLGNPVYNEYRPDVAALFPNYNNSDGAGGHFLLNTSNYPNGVHTIAWTVADNAGNADGIGSRYFTIQNTGSDKSCRGEPACSPVFDSSAPISDRYAAVRVKKGYDTDIEANEMNPDEEGVTHIEIHELERVEIYLSPGTVNLSPLPIGSTLDVGRGIFYWQPGPGFIGQYRLVFVNKAETGPVNREEVVITIAPKFPTAPAANRAPGHPTFRE
jgi:hypothetical protein